MAFYSVDPVIMEGVSSVTLTPSVELGTRINYAGNAYIYVQTKTCITAGFGCIPYATTLSYTVTNAGTLTGTSNTVFCGLVEHATAATDTYFWLLINGAGTFTSTITEVTAVGAKVGLGDDGCLIDWVPTLVTGAFAGHSLGLAATGVSAAVWVKSEVF